MNIFIILWATIYNYFFDNNLIDEIYLTKINWDFNCDTFVNINHSLYKLISNNKIEENWNVFNLLKYTKQWT